MQRYVQVACAAAAALAASLPGAAEAQGRPYGEGYFPNLPVVTHDGRDVRFYDELVKGKIVVISFIYTSCTDICPLTTARMAQVEEKLGEAVGRDIFLISMTVDPETDSPQKLRDYAKAFDAGPGWTFVTGRPEDVRAINYRLGERSKVLSDHRNEIVLGNDATGEWTRDNVMGDLERVVMTIRGMDPKWRAQVRLPKHVKGVDTGLAMSQQPGQALYKKACAPCHTVGVGDRVGPDLRGITERRDRGWLARFIRNPGKLRAENDPVALALADKYTVRMPALGISAADAGDLISYLEAENARLAAMKEPAAPHHHHGHGHSHDHKH